MNKEADLTVLRAYYNDCTIGRIFSKHFKKYFALLELPWLGNINDFSCIPEGLYDYEVRYSNRAKRDVIWILNVPNRTNIQWHQGNFTRDILGCGLTGLSVTDMNQDGIPDVSNSLNALIEIISKIPKKGKLRVAQANKPGTGVYL